MNVGEYKAGDKIYFKGNPGKVIRVTQDKNEALLEVALTQTRVAYLNPSQIDLYPFAERLNENQQIVLDWLKDKCNIYSFISYQPFEAIKMLSMLDPEKNELRVKNAIDELTYLQQSQILEVFSRWTFEQEEE